MTQEEIVGLLASTAPFAIPLIVGFLVGIAVRKSKKASECPLPQSVILDLVTKKFHRALNCTDFASFKDQVDKLYDEYRTYSDLAKNINQK